MSMSKEEIKEVIDAIFEGKEIEVVGQFNVVSAMQYIERNLPNVFNGTYLAHHFLVNILRYIDDGTEIRVKKEPIYRFYTKEDSKKLIGRTIKKRNSGNLYIITGVSSDSVAVASQWIKFDILFHNYSFEDVEKGESTIIGILE